MVVPLKLTQFYGHSVPRPRIYAAVKFNEHRVDPPPSVNDALLSWATDAHWSMGGLSFKRLRTQGKVEGNVRKLRAFLEEDEEVPEVSVKAKATASKAAKNADKVKSAAAKEASKPFEKKRQRSEEESVEATPARKLRRTVFLQESSEEGSPAFVPATEEKLQRKGKARAEPAVVVSAHNTRNKGLRSPSTAEVPLAETPSSVPSTGEKRAGKLFSASGKSVRGSNSPASNGKYATKASSASEGGRLTRSGKKAFSEDASVSPVQSSKGRPRARKILTRESLTSDGESSESVDGLEAFLEEKGRPLRRSLRLVKEQGNSLQNSSDSDSE